MSVTAIDTFESIKGGINNQCKDVYFVRAVGTSPAYINDIRKMDSTLGDYSHSGRGYYRRLGSLPKLQNTEDTAFYAECYSGWVECGRKEAVIRATKENNELAKLLGNACSAVEEICMREDMRMTESIRKNFMIKLLFWYDSIFGKEDFAWDGRKSIKIVADNITKKQEYLFFYLLTLTGCDVLLLQSRADIGEAEEKLNLSVKFVLGDYSELAIPEYRQERKESSPQIPAAGAPDVPVVCIPPHPSRASRSAQASCPPRRPETVVQTNAVSAVPVGNRSGNGRTESRNGNGNENGNGTGSEIRNRSEGTEKSFEELAQLASSVVMIAIHDTKGDVIGTGSGIMVGREGYILTNNHVASGGKFYSVRIEDDERVYETDEVIKYNYVLDLAVIRIQRKLVPLSVYQGRNKLVRGQKVVAIGSPLGLFNSVSDGIISGFRKIENVDMIQFTAPTSHGSSGGAVLNMQGEVIGISTAGYDAGQNINLAVGYECINTFIRGFT